MEVLTCDILNELGYKKEIQTDRDGDEYITWSNNILTLYEDRWSQTPNFSFATYVRGDGSFKGGWSIQSKEQLLTLEEGLSGKKRS